MLECLVESIVCRDEAVADLMKVERKKCSHCDVKWGLGGACLQHLRPSSVTPEFRRRHTIPSHPKTHGWPLAFRTLGFDHHGQIYSPSLAGY